MYRPLRTRFQDRADCCLSLDAQHQRIILACGSHSYSMTNATAVEDPTGQYVYLCADPSETVTQVKTVLFSPNTLDILGVVVSRRLLVAVAP